MITSRRRSKSQTTIPEAVREARKPKEGDDLVYVIEDGRGILVRDDSKEDIFSNPFATFTEWDSDADHRAYDKL